MGYYQPGPPDGWREAWDRDQTEWGQCCLVQDFQSGSSGDGWDLGADTGRGTLELTQGCLLCGTLQVGLETCRRGHPRGHRPVWPVAGAMGLCQQLWQDRGSGNGRTVVVATTHQMLCKRKGTELEMVNPLNTGCRVLWGFPRLWVPLGLWSIHGKKQV